MSHRSRLEFCVHGDSWVVVIGINDYENPSVPKLRYAVNTARSVEKALLGQGLRPERMVPAVNDRADIVARDINVAVKKMPLQEQASAAVEIEITP